MAENPDYQIIRKLGGAEWESSTSPTTRSWAATRSSSSSAERSSKTPASANVSARSCAVASLHHPKIVTAYTAFRAGESLVFAMEYAEGLDLARMVKAKGPLPVGHARPLSTRRRWACSMP